MKYVLFIACILFAGIINAQIAPKVTEAQLNQSSQIVQRQVDFEKAVEAKVTNILTVAKMDTTRKAELTELVSEKDMLIIRLERESLAKTQHDARHATIIKSYELKLKDFLGAEKYALLLKN